MATLNKTARGAETRLEKITNYEGAPAYRPNAKTKLTGQVLGAFWSEDAFYAKGSKLAEELVESVKAVAAKDPKFILQLAAYARNVIHMRTTPQVLLVEAAQIEGCKPFVREYTPKIVKRADEIAAVLAYHIEKYGGKDKNHNRIPNSLKKGLAAAFANFDEYQLNKYDSDKKEISLGDALLLIDRRKDYPVSKAMANYLINDVLDEEALPRLAVTKQILAKNAVDDEVKALLSKSVFTWEMFISKFGATKENWELIAPKMGYMAKLRNLRNFIDKGVDLEPILAEIENSENVKKSKQLPYRFFSAHKEIEVQRVQRALANAFEASISNVTLPGVTAVATDLSASMGSFVSAKSKIKNVEVGAVMSAMAVKKSSDSIAIAFGDFARKVNLNPDDRMMTNVQKIVGAHVGHSTNAWLIFKEIGNRKVDRVIIFSDMQCYNSYGSQSLKSEWNNYTKTVNPNAKLYSFNLAPYGQSQFPQSQGNVTELSGWSDKVIDYIALTENRGAMEEEIKKW